MSATRRSRATPQPRRSDARERAARSFFLGAGLAVDETDALRWEVCAPGRGRAYAFFPASGHFARPDGTRGSGGARALVAELRQG